MPASESLQAMAEGGNISALVDDVTAAGGVVVQDAAGGALAPGVSAPAVLALERAKSHLSIVAMLLPSNDGLVGLDSLRLPRVLPARIARGLRARVN